MPPAVQHKEELGEAFCLSQFFLHTRLGSGELPVDIAGVPNPGARLRVDRGNLRILGRLPGVVLNSGQSFQLHLVLPEHLLVLGSQDRLLDNDFLLLGDDLIQLVFDLVEIIVQQRCG